MSRYAIFAVFLLLAACSSAPVVEAPADTATSPIRLLIHSAGEGDAQVLAVVNPDWPAQPISALFRWSHNATIVGQPYPPYIIYEGDADLIVEPAPGQEQKAQESFDKGYVQIRRNGVVGRMNAPGSIDARKARTADAHSPEPVAPPPPPAPATSGLGEPPTGEPPATDPDSK